MPAHPLLEQLADACETRGCWLELKTSPATYKTRNKETYRAMTELRIRGSKTKRIIGSQIIRAGNLDEAARALAAKAGGNTPR